VRRLLHIKAGGGTYTYAGPASCRSVALPAFNTSSSIHQRGCERVLGVRLIVASDRHRAIWACVGPVTFV
jgi:hypothetical protein